jgi:folate-binding protein YgfZ
MSWEQEYQALSKTCAAIELAWAKFRFTGADRKKFLNGLVTNDVARLAPWAGQAACLLTPKGLLRAHFLLYDVGESVLVLCPARTADNFKAAMSKMIMLSESTFDDITGELSCLWLAGPETPRVLRSALGFEDDLRPYGARKISWQGSEIHVLSWPRLAGEGRLLLVPPGKNAVPGAAPLGPEAFNVWRVEMGLPLFGTDMGEETIPLEARLEDAVSFEKGCYMGQETISRVHNLGHLNKIMVGLKIAAAEPPPPGCAVIQDGREVGRLSSVVVSPKMGAILALATVRLESSKPGSVLGVASGRGSHRAEVVVLP